MCPGAAMTSTVTDPNYTGEASDTLVISPAVATVTLGDLAQTFDGDPKAVSATTSPIGLTVEIIDLGGHPLVYAETEIRPDRKTLLFYGHYDVQPVDPLDLWDREPFDPALSVSNLIIMPPTDGSLIVECISAE